ncbi:MAG: PAS domain-containing protein [Acidobacteria bacterium]|nr:PAS domain-containing protein [Acidobacteriota bacterium]
MIKDNVKLNLVQTLSQANLEIGKLIETIEDGVCVEDLERKIIHANSAFAKILGIEQEQIIDKTSIEVFSKSNLVFILSLFNSSNVENNKEELFNQNTGQRLRVKVSPIYDGFDKISGYLTIIRDITDVIQREREMARAEQLALIGELVAGLAHEIRNPLTGIQGVMDILIEKKGKNDPEKIILENARQEVWRIDAAIRSLLDRSRIRAMKLISTSLAKVAKSAVMLAQDQLAATSDATNRIQIIYLPSLDPIILPIDAPQIEDAILNLILNAIEAIDQRGQITVNLLKIMENGFNKEAVIEVKDNGRGIPKDNLVKIFNPFFSTKPYGTGLGLAAVKRILRAHNGRVEVDSIEGKGSAFRLYIPY